MFIMGGFTGHGMPQIFLSAKGISQMVLSGCGFEETGLPTVFEETSERLSDTENFVMGLYNSIPSTAKL